MIDPNTGKLLQSDPATAAINVMRPPSQMHIICVDVTNRCDLQCSNCTRLLANQAHFWDMTPDNFRTALRSLQGYPGVIAMIGGNPCLHKKFADLCQIFREEIPEKRQRGLWSNNVFKHQKLIADTFGFFNLNPHGDAKGEKSLERLAEVIPGLPFYKGHSKHAPILAAIKDIIPDEREMWEAISQCDINKHWSASIVENKGYLRAYFCEVAASFDLARGEDHGNAVYPGWWKSGISPWSHQIKHFCPGCGVAARLEARQDSDDTDDYTRSNADIALRTRGKRKVVEVTEPKRQAIPVTSYSESHRAGPDGISKISVVIPAYNAEDTIRDTINSVTMQQVPDGVSLEIIAVDDGSTDRTREIIFNMVNSGVGMHGTYQANAGPAAARNHGLKLATGDLICFLDADDMYNHGFFDEALTLFNADPELAAIITDIELVNCHREVHPVQKQAMVMSLPSNMIVRRFIADLVGGFPEDPSFRGPTAGEDVVFKQIIGSNFKVGLLAKPYLRYLIKRGSHFDRFIDSTRVENGNLVFVKPTEDSGQLAAINRVVENLRAKLKVIEAQRKK